MKTLKARHTSIRQIIDCGDGFIVLEEYYKYPEGVSNIYKVDYNFNAVWEAELPNPTDSYCNFMHQDKGKSEFTCSTWNGENCTIDVNTGKILKKGLSK